MPLSVSAAVNRLKISEKSEARSSRLYSLDALRGFDMFWIMGAERIFHEMSKIENTPFWTALSEQFKHPAWHGFAFYDLIFPLFLFLAGISTPFSVGKLIRKQVPKSRILQKVVKRGLTLVLLGYVYNHGLRMLPVDEIRFCSVLGRIGLAYMLANIIYLYFKPKGQLVWTAAILLGYWMLFLLGARPGFEAGDFSMEGNIVSYWDTLIVPGKLYLGIHDPEALVSTVPAVATALLGILTGQRLIGAVPEKGKRLALEMAAAGLLFVVLAQTWDFVFPINKNLWTSSFVLQCAGISLLLMSLFYYVIDVKGFRKWAFFFKIIGMNSILIYMSGRFISWKYSANALFGWLVELAEKPYQPVVYVFGLLAVQWLVLYFLYKKKTFLKV
ncbi:MAG: DUF5009 domain-containing protein [Cytophagales bacterium]|nr:DUF5009 domain-containing protein [Cytophagales bacterium]